MPAAVHELQAWLAPQGLDDDTKLDDNDPRKPIVDAARYLRNDRPRMDYPHYRRMGLPVTSALMESLVKEVNSRVKGTEMFGNDPDGAEAILHFKFALPLCAMTIGSPVILTPVRGVPTSAARRSDTPPDPRPEAGLHPVGIPSAFLLRG